jgi:Leucine-rich repeat (LRR) protein
MSGSQHQISQFTLRQLLVFIFILAIFFARFSAIWRAEARQQAAYNRLEELNCRINIVNNGSEEIFHYVNCELMKDFTKDLKAVAEVLPLLDGPVGVDLVCAPIEGKELAPLKNVPTLKELDLFGARLTADATKYIGDIRELRYLRLSSTHTTNDGLIHLSKLVKLETLYLPGTQINDEGLHHLWQLVNLKLLCLMANEIDGSGLAGIENLQQLQHLFLSYTRTSDIGIEHLQKLPSLNILFLTNTKVTDACLDALCSIKSLEQLKIDGTGITEDGIRRLVSELPNLHNLTISSTQASVEFLRELNSKGFHLTVLGN